jgi:hypothetical protein
MRFEEVKTKIAQIQYEHKDVVKLKNIADVYEPGQTGFVPKSGMLLVQVINVPVREKKIILNENQRTSADFMGVQPFIGLIMESGSSLFEVGKVICLSQEVTRRAYDVIINGCVGTAIYESDVLGTDTNI